MKTIHTATEARRSFFELLDRAVRGETVLIDRKGVPLQLIARRKKTREKPLDYRRYLHSAVDQADQWGWQWDPEKGLESISVKKKNP